MCNKKCAIILLGVIMKNICTVGDESLRVQFECKLLMSALIKTRYQPYMYRTLTNKEMYNKTLDNKNKIHSLN